LGRRLPLGPAGKLRGDGGSHPRRESDRLLPVLRVQDDLALKTVGQGSLRLELESDPRNTGWLGGAARGGCHQKRAQDESGGTEKSEARSMLEVHLRELHKG